MGTSTKQNDWWKSAVIYQIYPRSYYDTNNDGVGDLKGIIEKLPYMDDLGINAIWISPFFKSPMKDFGYDISDYYSVDTIFGTNFDVLKLINEAHKRDIKIIFDLVLNHCSSDHPWFVEARSSKDNPKRDWFMWQDTIPNNWESIFGGSSWTKCAITGQYYYHSFLPDQPDFNLRNPEVAAELKNILRYYLELGVDGFRLDAINTLYEDADLRDNPVEEICTDTHCDTVRIRKYDFDHFENFDLLDELKKVMNEYEDRVLIGEVSNISPDHDMWKRYFGYNKEGLDIVFNFDLLYEELDADLLRSSIIKWEDSPKGKWPSYAFGSHDQIRYPSRLGVTKDHEIDKMKLLSTFLLTVRGTPFIYYGDEIGLPEFKVPKELVKDPWPLRTNFAVPTRDGCRTPMIWDKSPQAGFSTNKQTWLPIHDTEAFNPVEHQLNDKNSILNWYKKLIAIRKLSRSLQLGDLELLTTAENVLAYSRTDDNTTTITILNLSSTSYFLEEHPTTKEILISNGFDHDSKELKPNGCIVYESSR